MYVPTHSHWGVDTLYIALFNKYLSGKKDITTKMSIQRMSVAGQCLAHLALEQRVFTSLSLITSQRRSCSICLRKKIKHLGSPLQTLSTHLSRSEWSDMWLLFSLSLVYCTSSRWWLNPPCVCRAHPGTSVMYHITSFNIRKYPELFSDCERLRKPGVSVYYPVRPRGVPVYASLKEQPFILRLQLNSLQPNRDYVWVR